MRYHLTTFGCQMNDHDSERMKGLLESHGWSEAGVRDDADLILFNTCTIRGSADERFLGNLGDAKRVKRERPEAIVAVGGCWAQSQKEAVFRDFPFVDIAFGPGEVSRIGELVARERIEAVGAFSFDGAFSGSLPAKRERPHQAWVQISVGCNCVCAYCIVPTVRGRERSRPVADVVARWPRSPRPACWRSRSSARTSTRTGATCRARSGRASPSCCAPWPPSPGSPACGTPRRTRRT